MWCGELVFTSVLTSVLSVCITWWGLESESNKDSGWSDRVLFLELLSSDCPSPFQTASSMASPVCSCVCVICNNHMWVYVSLMCGQYVGPTYWRTYESHIHLHMRFVLRCLSLSWSRCVCSCVCVSRVRTRWKQRESLTSVSNAWRAALCVCLYVWVVDV